MLERRDLGRFTNSGPQPVTHQPTLYPFQEIGVEFLKREQRALLADAPRLGKAVQSLNAAVGRTLVVAPSMVLEGGGWQKDSQIWRPDLDITFAPYSLLNQRETVAGKTGRKVSKVLDGLRPEYRGQWDTIILDESHHIKERKTAWTIAALRLSSERCFLLSGTPIPNWAHELFTTLQAIFPGDRRFTSYWRWVQEWFQTEKSRFNLAAIEIGGLKRGKSWNDFMRSNLGSHYLRRTWSEAGIQMPPFEKQVMWIKMHPRQKKAYDELKKDFITRVESGEISSEIQAWTTGHQSVLLSQLTTGLETLGLGAKGSGKLDMVRELLEDFEGEPVALFCHFRNTARALIDIARSKGRKVGLVMGGESDRGLVVSRFQSGDLDCLVGTIDTVSEGLQMWRSNICVRVERVWRPTSNEQVQDRLAYIGKTHPVRVIDLVTEETVDQRMLFELSVKTDQQMKALTAGEFAKML